MPLQNTGTLLENLTLVEASRLVFEATSGPVDLASAFAMPPLTVWRRAEKYAADSPLFTIAQLNAVAAHPSSTHPDSYRGLLRQCLRHDRTRGPNGALLVALLALHRSRSLRAWVEDVGAGTAHYGPTVPALEALGTYASAIGASNRSPFVQLAATSSPYPDCIDELRTRLRRWKQADPAEGRIGYLDPNSYHPKPQSGPHTSSADHRQWLEALVQDHDGWTVSIHFSSNRDTDALQHGLAHMHADARAAGYHLSRSYRHQAHSTTVSLRCPAKPDAKRYAQRLDDALQSGWMRWVEMLPPSLASSTDPLHIHSELEVA